MALHGFNGLQLTAGPDIKKVLKCIREQKERWGGHQEKRGKGRNPSKRKRRLSRPERRQRSSAFRRPAAIFLCRPFTRSGVGISMASRRFPSSPGRTASDATSADVPVLTGSWSTEGAAAACVSAASINTRC